MTGPNNEEECDVYIRESIPMMSSVMFMVSSNDGFDISVKTSGTSSISNNLI